MSSDTPVTISSQCGNSLVQSTDKIVHLHHLRGAFILHAAKQLFSVKWCLEWRNNNILKCRFQKCAGA
jgi:hypothetical protein